MKICKKCNKRKRISSFYLYKSGSPKYICKSCSYQQAEEYRQNNKEWYRNWYKDYYTKNKNLREGL